ncbi:MAG: UvrD-helicase domain-containing protein, partial [Clostridiales Family XIII bacterium]|nr:UvrD-helicase domain-containing protein [Clostridiales Family XIII bacterium]
AAHIAAELDRAYAAVSGIAGHMAEAGATAFAAKFDACLAALGEASETAGRLRAGADATTYAAAAATAAEAYDALGVALSEFTFPRFVAAGAEKAILESEKELITLRRNRVKKTFDDMKKRFFAKPLADYVADMNDTYPYAAFLAGLVKRYDELYSAEKRAAGVLDFSDFEHMALKILADEKVRAEYREKFDYIFIDEYQDTNYVQEALISRICREDNLFMVGDVKQSIYQFRLAEPGIFIDKYNRFGSGEGAAGCRIDLNLNFRSKESLLLDINAVFRRLMRADLSGIDYDDNAALRRGIDYAAAGYDGSLDSRARFVLIDRAVGDESQDELPGELAEMKDAELEALAAAAEIRRVMDGGVFFDIKEGVVRPYRYRDIVVLLKEARTSGQVWYDVLQACGIPAYISSGDGYFDTVEVETFVNLLKVIDNARQDVPLVSALYSPVFGFSLEDLAEIRLAYDDARAPFHKAFFAYAESGPPGELSERCKGVTERLAGWRYDESFMTLPDFIWKLLKESGYYDYAGALPSGTLRRANLRAIADRALSFTAGRDSSLFGFLGFTDAVRKKRMNASQIKLFGEGDDAVRIMTVHTSKGLEFPYIIAAQMGKSLRDSGRTAARFALHRRVGVAMEWEDPNTHTYRKTLAQHMIAAEQKRETRAEALRVLYVAMTRAMDRLTLIGTTKDAGKALSVAELADPEIDTDPVAAGSFLDMLLPILLADGRAPEVITSARLLAQSRVAGTEVAAGQGRDLSIDLFDDSVPTGAVRESLAAEVDRRLSFVYPYAEDLHTKSKYSATEINRALKPARPEKVFFTEGSAEERLEDAGNLPALSAAERGTALHTALEQLDFAEAYARRDDAAYFSAFVRGLADRGFLTREAAESVSPETLRRYANTELFARAAAAPLLRKETPFNLKYEHLGREVIVQGIIDCWFAENGSLVLIDYKSGGYRAADPAEAERVAAEYGVQMDIYRTALERITGRAVAESWLYMTSAGAAVPVPPEKG